MAGALELRDVLALLGVREGMRDARYFVGRQRECDSLAACHHGAQRNSAWIHGARRIGKSSVARELERRAEDGGTPVLRACASREPGVGIDTVLDWITDEAQQRGLIEAVEGRRPDFYEWVRARSSEPLLIVFEEFDSVAVNLSQDDQARLRSLVEACPGLAYLFVTRLDPNHLVDECPDEHSRILGVCALERLRPLERRAVRELAERVCRDVPADRESAEVRLVAEQVWKAVGGYSVTVMAAMRGLGHFLASGEPVDELALENELERCRDDLESQLSSYWWNLDARTRRAILDAADDVDEATRYALQRDGFFVRRKVVRPTLLVEVGRRKGLLRPRSVASSDDAERTPVLLRMEALQELTTVINDELKLRDMPEAFVRTNEAGRWHTVSRATGTRAGLKEAVEHLYKVYFEGARRRSADGPEFRLRDELGELYRGSPVIRDLNALRNHFDHDQSRPQDGEKRNRDFAKAGDIFERRCGVRSPQTPAQWIALRDSLLEELHRLLEELVARITAEQATVE